MSAAPRSGQTHPERKVRRARSPIGREFGRLVVTRVLGRGGSGEVFEVEDRADGRRLVLKTLRIGTGDPVDLARFRREATFMTRLRNPHIMPVLHVAVEEDPPYFLMPLLEGRCLADRPDGPLNLGFVLSLARDICYALTAVHRFGIVHRDVKPQNVFVEKKTGRAVLFDFGIARRTSPDEEALTAAGYFVGTPPYMAPEHCLGRKVSDRADVCSLGVMIMELVLGSNPFEAPSVKETLLRHVEMQPRRLDTAAPGRVSAELGELVERMISKKPENRPRAESCLEALAGLARAHEWRTGSGRGAPPS